MLKAEVGDITKVNTEAIVNAANGIGVLGKGVAGAIRQAAGDIVRDEARSKYKENKFPFEEGTFYTTSAGSLIQQGIKSVYHAVTMKFPGSRSSLSAVEKVLNRILVDAQKNKIKSIAIPGLGTGIGGLDKTSVANITAIVCRKYSMNLDILIIDIDERFIDAVKKNILVQGENHP